MPEPPTGPYAVLNGVLDELVEHGVLPSEQRPGADIACWALVHGFAELHLNRPLCEMPAEMRGPMLETVLDVVQPGLVADQPTNSRPRPARSPRSGKVMARYGSLRRSP